jgi:hypothetical protein
VIDDFWVGFQGWSLFEKKRLETEVFGAYFVFCFRLKRRGLQPVKFWNFLQSMKLLSSPYFENFRQKLKSPQKFPCTLVNFGKS